MGNVPAIVMAIYEGQHDDLLDAIVDAVRDRRKVMGQRLGHTLRPSTRVETIVPLTSSLVGLKGTVSEIGKTRAQVVFDKGQFVGNRFQRSIDHGMPLAIPLSCLRVLEDQTPPAHVTERTNGAIVERLEIGTADVGALQFDSESDNLYDTLRLNRRRRR